jgi:hypothetical protein
MELYSLFPSHVLLVLHLSIYLSISYNLIQSLNIFQYLFLLPIKTDKGDPIPPPPCHPSKEKEKRIKETKKKKYKFFHEMLRMFFGKRTLVVCEFRKK